MYEIAHRGDSDLYKDNTMEGLKSAVSKKFDIIEIDVTLTKDNYVIIYHDTFIEDKLIKDMKVEIFFDENEKNDHEWGTLKRLCELKKK